MNILQLKSRITRDLITDVQDGCNNACVGWMLQGNMRTVLKFVSFLVEVIIFHTIPFMYIIALRCSH